MDILKFPLGFTLDPRLFPSALFFFYTQTRGGSTELINKIYCLLFCFYELFIDSDDLEIGLGTFVKTTKA